jgi:tRNA(Ile)-lysidine synthase
MHILRKVYTTVQGFDLIRPREGVLLGVSGGPDSVAMLDILYQINKVQGLGWRFHIAHLNHGLRGTQADQDEVFVRRLAKSYGIGFTSRKVQVEQLRAFERGSLEEVARKVRHEFLKELGLKLGVQKISLAHTMDDQAETILHRIIRGTGLRGLKGMVPIRLISRSAELFLVRPLIEISRTEVQNYLAEHKLSYRLDASNQDLSFTRNRIRHALIPFIEKEFNPRFKTALVKLGQTSASFYILLKEIANEVFENMKMLGKENEICVSADEFAKTPPAIQTLIVDKIVKTLLGKIPQLNFEHYLEILSLCSQPASDRVVMLPRGLQAKREAYLLKIYRPEHPVQPPSFSQQLINVPGKTVINELSIQVEAEIIEGRPLGLSQYIQSKDYNEEVIDIDKVMPPLSIRLRRKGDVFSPLGSKGSCKLKKFFIDNKIPRGLRDRIPLITDKNKIIWVVGYRIGDGVKVTESTHRLLKLKVTRI